MVGGRERDYTWVGEGLIGELLDDGDVGAFGELVAPGPQDGAPIEAARLSGEPVGPQQSVADRVDPVAGQVDGTGLSQHLGALSDVPSGLGDLFGPAGVQFRRFDGVVLGVAGVEDRVLRGARRAGAPSGHLGLDLAPSGREQLEDLGRDPVQVGEPVDDRAPGDTEPRCQLAAQVCSVEVPGGLGLEVEVPGIERTPAAIRAAGPFATST